MQIHECRVCGSADLETVFDLGKTPWANDFRRPGSPPPEKRPLRVARCAGCAAAQLDYTIPKEAMFRDHAYRSGASAELREHFAGMAQRLLSRSAPDNPGVLDIGSNDGAFLKECLREGAQALGVESCAKAAKAAEEAGVPTLCAFFNEKTASQLPEFDIVHASGVLFHLEELHSALEGVRRCLKEEGVFAVEFIYTPLMLKRGHFDQIYHEHLLYYTLRTLDFLLRRHGLHLYDADFTPVHGGSALALASKTVRAQSPRLQCALRAEDNSPAPWKALKAKADRTKDRLLRWLEGKTSVFGLGAPAKACTLLSYCGLGEKEIPFLAEICEEKIGLVSPNGIPVVREGERTPEHYLALAWNYKKSLEAKRKALLPGGGEVYFPAEI